MIKINRSIFLAAAMAVVSVFPLASCQNMLTPDSDTVEFEEDNQLNSAHDSLYSVLGIVRQMQVIADRTVILGEIRGDLVTKTDKASPSIQQLATFNVEDDNVYNNIADYYSIINNCNYFLKNVKMDLYKLGTQVFEKEYAVVKTYRAWTYLQLAKVYGNVPLVLDPITTISQADLAQQQDYRNIDEICNYFIDDLKPYVNTIMPNYAVTANGTELLGTSRKFFIPVRVLLGELCLWVGRYEEAAQYFYEFLTFNNHCVQTGDAGVFWGDNIKDAMKIGTQNPWSRNFPNMFSSASSSEVISYIPMEESEFNGVKSWLRDVFCSTENNKYFVQVVPSIAMKQLSASQTYCQVTYPAGTTQKVPVILRPEDYNVKEEKYIGDLRFGHIYNYDHQGVDITSHYSSDIVTINKLSSTVIPTYRVQQIYLMFAEALNRAGYPETAFAILKYGLCESNIYDKNDPDHPIGKMGYLSKEEQVRAARFLNQFTEANGFKDYNTKGIHSRGCGDASDNSEYAITVPHFETLNETINYMIPLVEQKILDEMALEQSFEGTRYYDLMRIAKHRNNPAILAEAVAKRNGTKDEALFTRLMDKKNWYLPIKK